MDTHIIHTDSRITRTRKLLRESLIDLLLETELVNITVNRIAKNATINRVTFYLHYRDIPDMLDKLAEGMIEDLRQILYEENPISSVNEDIALVKLLEHISANDKFYKAVLSLRRIPIFTEKLLELLSDLIKEKVEKRSESSSSHPMIQKDIAIWYGSSALIGVIISWLRNDMPYSPRYLADQFRLLTSLR